MAREYFLAYFDYLDATSELSDAECGRLFKAALKYGQSGEVSKLCGNEKFAFGFIKKQIDRDNEKYEQKCEINRKNGMLGGKTKDERKILANGSERFSNMAFAPKKKKKENTKTNISLTPFEIYNNAREVKNPKIAYGEFKNVLLASGEVEKLRDRLGKDFENLLEEMSSGIAAKGYKYKDHYAAILNWSKRKSSNKGGNKNGLKISTDADFEGKPKINKYPDSTQYDDSWFKK